MIGLVLANILTFCLILILSPLLLLPVKSRVEHFVYRFWASLLCGICNIHLKVLNPPDPHPTSTLFVSNHLAMVDIPLLFRALNVRLVSKMEVKYWPIVGQGAWLIGTLFIDRSSKKGLHQLLTVVKDKIQRGTNVLAFPEGTTGDGKTILPLNSPFFSLSEKGVRTLPVFISYTHVNGEPADPDKHKFLFYGEGIDIVQHMGYVLGCRRLDAEIELLPELKHDKGRKELVPMVQEMLQARLSERYSRLSPG